jgi:hypothetical protein
VSSIEDEGSHRERQDQQQDRRKNEYAPRGVLGRQGAHRGDERRVPRHGEGLKDRSWRAQRVAGQRLVVTTVAKREGSSAVVPDQVAAAAPHLTETPRHRDSDGHTVLAKTGDLIVLLHSGQEEDDDEDGQSHERQSDDDTSNTVAVYVQAGPAQGHDGRLLSSGDSEIVAARLFRLAQFTHW